MRSLLSALLSLIAAVLAFTAVFGWRVDQLMHNPETIRDIAGTQTVGADVQEALTETLGDSVNTGFPAIDEVLGDAVTQAATSVTYDPGFEDAWDEALEETRAGWVKQLSSLSETYATPDDIPDDAGQLKLVLDPVVELSKTSLAESLDESLREIPGVAELNISASKLVEAVPAELTIDTALPPASMVPAKYLMWVEEYSSAWPVAMLAAVALFLIALIVAAPRRRFVAWVMVGLVFIAGAAAAWLGAFVVSRKVAGSGDELRELIMSSVQSWLNTPIFAIGLIGIVMVITGMVVAVIRPKQYSRRYR